MKKIMIAAAAALMLSACAGTGMGTKETIGTGLGGIGGAVAGAQFGKGKGRLVGVAAGTLLGAFLGNQIGQSLDKADQMYAEQSFQQAAAAPVGQEIAWSNPKSGNRGRVKAVREGRRTDGAYCREFQQTIIVGGKTEQGYGTACQMPDGSWKIQD